MEAPVAGVLDEMEEPVVGLELELTESAIGMGDAVSPVLEMGPVEDVDGLAGLT